MKRFKVYSAKISDMSLSEVNETVKQFECPEPTVTKPVTTGFIRPFELLDATTDFIVGLGSFGYGLILIKEKKPKRSEVTRWLNAKLKQDREAGKTYTQKERRELRKTIEKERLQHTEPEETLVHVVFDFNKSEIWLSCASGKKRDIAKELIQGAAIDLMDRTISITMESDLTAIINEPNKLPEHMDLGRSTSMKEPSIKSTVRYRAQDLAGDEVAINIKKNKEATQLEFYYRESVHFTLGTNQEITGIKYDLDAVSGWLDLDVEDDTNDELFSAQRRIRLTIEIVSYMIPKIYGIFATLHGAEEFSIE